MTIYLTVSFVLLGLLVLAGKPKTAFMAGLLAIACGFGYRFHAGESARDVVADVFLVLVLVPIGWWIARQSLRTLDSRNAAHTD